MLRALRQHPVPMGAPLRFDVTAYGADPDHFGAPVNVPKENNPTRA